MTREAALLVILAVAVALLGLAAWGWMRRTSRDAGYAAPIGEAPVNAAEIAVFPGLYVATTRHDEPLERVAVRRLGFRSRVDVTVTDAGVALDLVGQPRMFLPTESLIAVDQSTVAIDRVVERDGLARLAWRIDPSTVVDSYVRLQDASSRALVDAIRPLISTSTPTGSAA